VPGRPSDSDIRVVPPVLDRLTDEAPGETADALATRAESVRQFRRSVQRDLENLLNARNPFKDLSEGFAEVRRSVVAYGLNTIGFAPLADRERVRQDVKNTIATFEPRLTDVVVELEGDRGQDRNQYAQSTSNLDPSLRLRVYARLLIEPSPEQISFDVVMPVETSRFEVKDPN
jgi:type VI secretion system protein ImpF